MNIDTAFPSKYVSATDLAGQAVDVVIDRVVCEEIEQGKDWIPVVYFQGFNKGLVLNKTNATRIKEMYGAETDFWKNRQITIRPETTQFQGRVTDCVRVVPGQQQAPMQPPIQQTPAPQPVQQQQPVNTGVQF